MSKLRIHVRRPSPSMVVALLALLLALSGPAGAARRLFTGDDIQDDSLTGVDVDESTLSGVDAATLDTMDSTDFLNRTGKAADSDLLDGLNSSAFLGASAKAADSNQLDGLDSTQFLRDYEISPPPQPLSFNSDAFKANLYPCPLGKSAISGGAMIVTPTGYPTKVALIRSFPIEYEGRIAWLAAAHEMGDGTTEDWALGVYVVCATVN